KKILKRIEWKIVDRIDRFTSIVSGEIMASEKDIAADVLRRLFDPTYEDAWIKQLQDGIDKEEQHKLKLYELVPNEQERKRLEESLEKGIAIQRKALKEANERKEDRRIARQEFDELLQTLSR